MKRTFEGFEDFCCLNKLEGLKECMVQRSMESMSLFYLLQWMTAGGNKPCSVSSNFDIALQTDW